MQHVVDNPGGGDCGYYSFAIGLIEQIQKQARVNQTSALFEKWQKLGLQGVSLAQIKAIDLAELARNPRTYEKDLLKVLQQSLRQIGFNQKRQDCRLEEISRASLFNDFCAMVRGQADEPFNVLNTEQVKHLIAMNDLNPDSTVDEMAAVFLKDVREPNSIVLAAGARVTAAGYWATHTDLAEVAEALGANLKVAGAADGSALKDRPTICLINQGNYHWQTQLETPIPMQAYAPRMFAPTAQLREEVLKLKIDIAADKKIALSDIDVASAHEGESDEDFAKRLQEAEIRRFRP